MQQQRLVLGLIAALAIGAIAILVVIPLQLGLDLKGGAQLTIQVKPTDKIQNISPEDLETQKVVLGNRVNALGVAEPIVQTLGQDKIVIQLPGVTDSQQAERVLGGTAQLEFREQKQGTEGQFQAEFTIKRQLEVELAVLRRDSILDENAERVVELTQSIGQSNL
ncbi:MAG: protein translocase subunit SecD, partial [cyanobacterium endosymbiont of Rhopalodia yunnanensis]